jgi:hypothetical protein
MPAEHPFDTTELNVIREAVELWKMDDPVDKRFDRAYAFAVYAEEMLPAMAVKIEELRAQREDWVQTAVHLRRLLHAANQQAQEHAEDTASAYEAAIAKVPAFLLTDRMVAERG